MFSLRNASTKSHSLTTEVAISTIIALYVNVAKSVDPVRYV